MLSLETLDFSFELCPYIFAPFLWTSCVNSPLYIFLEAYRGKDMNTEHFPLWKMLNKLEPYRLAAPWRDQILYACKHVAK